MPLFSSCSQCGKKTFSFFLNQAGLCNSCVAKNSLEKEQREAAQKDADIAYAGEFYDKLSALWKKTGDCWYRDFASFDAATEAISDCNELEGMFQEMPNIPYFPDTFAAHCSFFNEDACSNQDFGRFKVEKVGENANGSILKINWDGHLLQLSRRRDAAQQIIDQTNLFQETLDNLPLVKIEPQLDVAPKHSDISSGIETKNITARTRLDRLNPFYTIDVETTGLNPIRNEVIQLAAVKFVNFEPVEAFCTYIKPRNGLDPRAQAVNGITDEDVKDAPYIESIAHDFSHFINPDVAAKTKFPLVGHNLSFDLNFLMASGADYLFLSSRNCYDTLELAKREYSDGPYKLDYLARRALKIYRDDAHDALSDALITGLLFRDICKRRIGF